MADTVKTLDQNDADEISALLVGRRIVAVEQGRFERPDGQSWGGAVTGKLTLDDGTMVYVAPNEGGCACSAGDYALTALAACDNIITSVRLAAEADPEDPYGEPDQSYRIYVLADAVEINAVQIDGNDGNGYYGTGYELLVVLPDAADRAPLDAAAIAEKFELVDGNRWMCRDCGREEPLSNRSFREASADHRCAVAK